MDKKNLNLPTQATGRIDIGRLLHEAELIDSFLQQAAIRQPGTPVKMPKTSRLMDEFMTSNQLNLLRAEDRTAVIGFLTEVKAKAPVLHISFGVDPAPAFSQKLVTWLRQNIHPFALIQIGLQPNIGAGCVVRSTNKYFDFSLREHFKDQKQLLIQSLHGTDKKPAPVAETATPTQETPQPQQATAPVQAAPGGQA